MKLISFNFDKICVEKGSKKMDELKINTNIEILDIKEVKSDFKIKGELLSVKFKYDIEYSSNFAKINFIGNILLSLESKESKNLLKEFKNKKISDYFKIPLFNFILRKSNIKALELEDELSIPLHIRLPYLKEKEK
jgi:hypothetical protein